MWRFNPNTDCGCCVQVNVNGGIGITFSGAPCPLFLRDSVTVVIVDKNGKIVFSNKITLISAPFTNCPAVGGITLGSFQLKGSSFPYTVTISVKCFEPITLTLDAGNPSANVILKYITGCEPTQIDLGVGSCSAPNVNFNGFAIAPSTSFGYSVPEFGLGGNFPVGSSSYSTQASFNGGEKATISMTGDGCIPSTCTVHFDCRHGINPVFGDIGCNNNNLSFGMQLARTQVFLTGIQGSTYVVGGDFQASTSLSTVVGCGQIDHCRDDPENYAHALTGLSANKDPLCVTTATWYSIKAHPYVQGFVRVDNQGAPLCGDDTYGLTNFPPVDNYVWSGLCDCPTKNKLNVTYGTYSGVITFIVSLNQYLGTLTGPGGPNDQISFGWFPGRSDQMFLSYTQLCFPVYFFQSTGGQLTITE